MTERFPRIACAVPGCRRGSTLYPPDTEIVCAKHWRCVSAKLKERYRRARRLYRRRPNVGMGYVLDSIWAQCRDDAIKAGAGL